MAYTIYRTRPTGLSSRAALTVVDFVGRLSDWNDARRTRNALSRLSNHELDDIGLSRGDIERVANRNL
ncbi:MAG: DUF1127 domain-containing protein [Silicimonas sp.]|jgi:uncharacterized protein YjiS (DUF1127 family)|nr:DUF1127 domain-containing protein [Silicimonas sp.]